MQLAPSALPLGPRGVNSIEMAKHVEPIAESWRTGVQIPPAPPIPKIPTLIGWDFFCPFPQCWRGFRAWPRERRPCEVVFFAPTDASLFSVFSGGHAGHAAGYENGGSAQAGSKATR